MFTGEKLKKEEKTYLDSIIFNFIQKFEIANFGDFEIIKPRARLPRTISAGAFGRLEQPGRVHLPLPGHELGPQRRVKTQPTGCTAI